MRFSTCLSCGYTLQGLDRNHCPECGWRPTPEDYRSLRSKHLDPTQYLVLLPQGLFSQGPRIRETESTIEFSSHATRAGLLIGVCSLLASAAGVWITIQTLRTLITTGGVHWELAAVFLPLNLAVILIAAISIYVSCYLFRWNPRLHIDHRRHIVMLTGPIGNRVLWSCRTESASISIANVEVHSYMRSRLEPEWFIRCIDAVVIAPRPIEGEHAMRPFVLAVFKRNAKKVPSDDASRLAAKQLAQQLGVEYEQSEPTYSRLSTWF